MTFDAAHWQERLRQLIAEHGVAGASVGVLVGDDATTIAAGVVNAETAVEATPDAVFKIGSITKVFVAVAALRLVEAGKLDLDAPVRTVLPEFRVADPAATERTTLRHLLSHTSGIAGDDFFDTGRGDDALERYVAYCATLGQDVPLGAAMSYSNTGFSIVGRLIEQVTGEAWDEAMRRLVYEPLALRRTATLPEDALRFRTAWGHEPGPDGPQLVDRWALPRSTGPAGAICASAGDVLALARMLLRDGATDAGPLLSAGLTRELLHPQTTVPDRWLSGGLWGLGVRLHDIGGRRVFGHDGTGCGQSAFLAAVPDRGVAVTALTNDGRVDLGLQIVDELLRELADLELFDWPRADASATAAAVSPSTYARHGVRLEVAPDGTRLRARLTALPPATDDGAAEEAVDLTLEPSATGPDVYVTHVPSSSRPLPVVFFDAGGQRYVHFGGRALAQVTTDA